jgi:phage I-like protein
MKTALHTYFKALHAADGSVPDWLELIPAGTFSGVDGRGPYINDKPEDVVAIFNAEGRKLPIDENHSIDFVGGAGLPSPARGWITALEVRQGSIWGKVEWTDAGKALMTDQAYGFLSPVFLHGKQKPMRVAKLLRVALTNNPNLDQLKSLHSQQETDMLEELRKALGLPETADEAAVMAAVMAAHTANQAHVALMARIATVANVAAGTTGDALVAALQTAVTKPTGEQTTEIANLQGQLLAMQNQLTSYVQVTSKDKAVSVIDKAVQDGKIIPALRDHYVARHMKDSSEVEKEISLLPSLNAGGLGKRQPPQSGDTVAPDADELKVAALMGIDATAFAATHKTIYGKAVL